MVRARIIYTCQSCGYQSPKWLGRCPDCLSWNSLLEGKIIDNTPKNSPLRARPYHDPQPIKQVVCVEEERLSTGIGELDRVLGGGIVPGSIVLVGGDPGIGKSTLLLQALHNIAQWGKTALYVSGEESPGQIKLRGSRLGVDSEGLYIYAESTLERIMDEIERLSPEVLVIDSIQTMYSQEFSSTPGSITQLRETTAQLVACAKRKDLPVFLIGHVTKEGSIAGPKVLEHMVDTVLYFEGDRGHPFRLLRAIKNRFGSINEIGVFEMRHNGLKEVSNPSDFFISRRPEGAAGSVVVASIEGSRPILIEIQSLVTPTLFGMPTRTVVGMDHKKVSLLVAVLEKKVGLHIGNHDIFLKIGGGISVGEPAIDLGVIVSLTSNFLDKPVDMNTIIFGEVGLTGEIRGVYQVEQRIRESEKLGFKRCILPKDNLKGHLEKGTTIARHEGHASIELIGVKAIEEVMGVLFE